MVAAAPAMLGTAALASLSTHLGTDTYTHRVTIGVAVGSAALSTAAVVGAVSEMGTVVGLSGAGISSGLAAAGGGSIAAGGGGMAAGLMVCAAVPVAVVLGVGAVAWSICQSIVFDKYLKRMRQWESEGAAMPDAWHKDALKKETEVCPGV